MANQSREYLYNRFANVASITPQDFRDLIDSSYYSVFNYTGSSGTVQIAGYTIGGYSLYTNGSIQAQQNIIGGTFKTNLGVIGGYACFDGIKTGTLLSNGTGINIVGGYRPAPSYFYPQVIGGYVGGYIGGYIGGYVGGYTTGYIAGYAPPVAGYTYNLYYYQGGQWVGGYIGMYDPNMSSRDFRSSYYSTSKLECIRLGGLDNNNCAGIITASVSISAPNIGALDTAYRSNSGTFIVSVNGQTGRNITINTCNFYNIDCNNNFFYSNSSNNANNCIASDSVYRYYNSIVTGNNNCILGLNNNSILGGSFNSICNGPYDLQLYPAGCYNSLVGGYYNSIIGSNKSAVLAGECNIVNGYGMSYSNIIIGGETNKIQSNRGHQNLIGNGCCNTISQIRNGSILNGCCNAIGKSDFSGIGFHPYTTILNGVCNTIYSSVSSIFYSSILGGCKNTICGTGINSYILGSGIIATERDTTYVNSISVGGGVRIGCNGYIDIGNNACRSSDKWNMAYDCSSCYSNKIDYIMNWLGDNSLTSTLEFNGAFFLSLSAAALSGIKPLSGTGVDLETISNFFTPTTGLAFFVQDSRYNSVSSNDYISNIFSYNSKFVITGCGSNNTFIGRPVFKYITGASASDEVFNNITNTHTILSASDNAILNSNYIEVRNSDNNLSINTYGDSFCCSNVNSTIGGSNNSFIQSNASLSLIGTNNNFLTGSNRNSIINGAYNNIDDTLNVIINGTYNNILSSNYGTIISSDNSTISGALQSSIIGSFNSTIGKNLSGVVILGVDDLELNSTNSNSFTTYVCDLVVLGEVKPLYPQNFVNTTTLKTTDSTLTGFNSFILKGSNHTLSGINSQILGGLKNKALSVENSSSLGGIEHWIEEAYFSTAIDSQSAYIYNSAHSNIFNSISSVVENSRLAGVYNSTDSGIYIGENTFILAGKSNTINDSINVSMLGGICNWSIRDYSSNLSNGFNNITYQSECATIDNGSNNRITNSNYSSVYNGNNNRIIDSCHSTIINGFDNYILSLSSSYVLGNTLTATKPNTVYTNNIDNQKLITTKTLSATDTYTNTITATNYYLYSPNGNRYKLQVSNTGSLTAVLG